MNHKPPPLRIHPTRTTRGVPKVSYEKLLHSTHKYTLTNYVRYRKLSKACESFLNQLSIVHLPNSVQDALEDPRRKEAINREMKSLKKM